MLLLNFRFPPKTKIKKHLQKDSIEILYKFFKHFEIIPPFSQNFFYSLPKFYNFHHKCFKIPQPITNFLVKLSNFPILNKLNPLCGNHYYKNQLTRANHLFKCNSSYKVNINILCIDRHPKYYLSVFSKILIPFLKKNVKII